MKHLLLFATCIILLGSCRPQYYKPNRVNAPLLTQKGQVQANAGFNGVQAAYSPAKHLGLIAGYSNYTYDGHEPWSAHEKVNFFEAGAGYYRAVKDTAYTKRHLQFVYDVYGGMGRGKINITNVQKNSLPSATITRAFVQPGVGIRTQVVEAAFNMRVCGVYYDQFSKPPLSPKYPLRNKLYIFTEPAITLRVGYKAAKLEMQYIHSFGANTGEMAYVKNVFNLGISVVINGYKKGK